MSNKLKVIIVEDEHLAAEGLKSYVKELDFLELCAHCENAIEAGTALNEYSPDLMFLDIQMPKITGIDFLKTLKNPPLVIFTTAYPNYALQGYELDVVDYLVKPYPFDRFLKAVNKARELKQYKEKTEQDQGRKDHFYLKTDQKFERVNFEDILWVEAMENYVMVHTTDQKLMSLMTMISMEDMLPGNFMRIHKTYIVNMDLVKAIEGNELHMGKGRLPISRQKKNEVMERLLK
jgi:DNA-binding LytR/AlgR family response regulator